MNTAFMLRRLRDATDEQLIRFVRWARKSNELRGILLEMVDRDTLEDEAAWHMDPWKDRGMY